VRRRPWNASKSRICILFFFSLYDLSGEPFRGLQKALQSPGQRLFFVTGNEKPHIKPDSRNLEESLVYLEESLVYLKKFRRIPSYLEEFLVDRSANSL
jgi:hypothetical protein